MPDKQALPLAIKIKLSPKKITYQTTGSRYQCSIGILCEPQAFFGNPSVTEQTFLLPYQADFPTCSYLGENSWTAGVQRQKCPFH